MTHSLQGAHRLIDSPPALIAQDLSLFDYAMAEAKAARVIAARIAEAVEQRDAAQALTEETVEWKEAIQAKNDAVLARKAAIERDPEVERYREAAKAARKALRKVGTFRTAKALTKD